MTSEETLGEVALRNWNSVLQRLQVGGHRPRVIAYPHVDAQGNLIQVEDSPSQGQKRPVVRRAIVLRDARKDVSEDMAAEMTAAPWHWPIFDYSDLVSMLQEKHKEMRGTSRERQTGPRKVIDLILPDGRRIETAGDYWYRSPRAVYQRYEYSDPAAVRAIVGVPEESQCKWWICWGEVDEWGLPGGAPGWREGECSAIIWGGPNPNQHWPNVEGPYDSESQATSVYNSFPLGRPDVYWPGTIQIWDGLLNDGPIGANPEQGREYRVTIAGDSHYADTLDQRYTTRHQEAVQYREAERKRIRTAATLKRLRAQRAERLAAEQKESSI